jgi:TatD DNase family protein
MFIDSHCHLDRLDLSPYENGFVGLVSDSLKQGIEHMLCVSITLEKYHPMRALIDPFPEISVSVGVHPTETKCAEPTVNQLITLASDERVVAIGETGLDYFRVEGGSHTQKDRFRSHIHAAIETNKPLIIHTRDAREDTLSLLKDERADRVGGVLHCFTEDWETAQRAIDLNFYISFSGIVTFKNAQQIQDVARRIPDDRFLIETDSPYLAPIPLRGKPNYPAYVKYVAEMLGRLRGVSTESIAETSRQNYYSLFGKPNTPLKAL